MGIKLCKRRQKLQKRLWRFFDAALSQFKETANNVVFFAYKKHLTCIVSYLFVWYHSFIILMEGIFAEETDGKKTDM